MIEPIDADRQAEDVSRRYPYLLATTYHRAYYEAPELDESHEYLLDLFEVTLKYSAAIVLSQYFADRLNDPRINQTLQSLQRPSLGHWLGWLRDILELYRRERRPTRVPELGAYFFQKNTTGLFKTWSDLRKLMVDRMGYEGDGRNVASITPLQFFQLLVEYRNKLAHGVRPSRYDRQQVAGILQPALRELLAGMSFLADYRLVFVNSVNVEFASGQSGAYRFAHNLTYLTGDRPRVSQRPQILPETPAHAGEVYLLDKTADFQPLLSLHPLIIFRHCASCNREQVFVLNLSTDTAADYLSYACTHRFSPTEYLDDMRALLGKLDPVSLTGPTAPSVTNGASDEALDPVAPLAPEAVTDLAGLPASDLAKAPDVVTSADAADPARLAKGARQKEPDQQSKALLAILRTTRGMIAGGVFGILVLLAVVQAIRPGPGPTPTSTVAPASPLPTTVSTSVPTSTTIPATATTVPPTPSTVPATSAAPTVTTVPGGNVVLPPQPTPPPAPTFGPNTDAFLLYRDYFFNPNSGWSKSSTQPGKYELGYANGEYRMAELASQFHIAVYAPKNNLTNFGAEVEAHLESAAMGGSYGLVFRVHQVQDVQADNGYHFLVNPGRRQYKLTKTVNGQVTDLVPWTDSILIFTGVTVNDLKVVANSTSIALWINGTHVKTVSDTTFSQGWVGLITVAETGPTAALFAKLVVSNPNILYYDDFLQSTSGFPTASTSSKDISQAYARGAYQMGLLTAPGSGTASYWASALLNQLFRVFDDFSLDVDAQMDGATRDGSYALQFRAQDNANYYVFRVDPNTGKYRLDKVVNKTPTVLVGWTGSTAIRRGTAPNHLGVVAKGSTISISVNGTPLNTLTDSSIGSGKIALQIDDWYEPISARFANLVVAKAE